jgi:glutamate-1-semialdehyde aminotransferase
VRPVVNYRATMESNHMLYERVAGAMRERGVEVEPDWREPMFLCAALSDADVDETLNVFNDSLRVTLSKIAPLP